MSYRAALLGVLSALGVILAVAGFWIVDRSSTTVRADVDEQSIYLTSPGETTASALPLSVISRRFVLRNLILGESVRVCTDEYRNSLGPVHIAA